MVDRDIWPVCALIKLGPNTIARLDEVILFKSLRSITYRTRETHTQFEALTAVLLRIPDFWQVTMCQGPVVPSI